MSKVVRRRFGRAFKLEVVRRMQAGESGTALSRELGIKRTIFPDSCVVVAISKGALESGRPALPIDNGRRTSKGIG